MATPSRDPYDADPGEFVCDWQHGICVCPGCGAIVRVAARPHSSARVVDGDGREHWCSRQVAAVLAKHGVQGLGGMLAKHAERPVIDKNEPPADRSYRRTGL